MEITKTSNIIIIIVAVMTKVDDESRIVKKKSFSFFVSFSLLAVKSK